MLRQPPNSRLNRLQISGLHLSAQIKSLDILIVQKLLTGAGQPVSAQFQDAAPMGNGKAFAGVLFDQKKRNSCSVHFLNFLKNKINNQGRQSKRWFVKKDQPRVQDEYPAQSQHLALSP